tara:strand:- start:61 stop:306 length:246 start_codon:yes stop_codon:yes gene_type:complete
MEDSPFYNDYEMITNEELEKCINEAYESYNKLEKKETINQNTIVKSVYLTRFSILALFLAVNFITYVYYNDYYNLKRIGYY